MAFSMWGMDLSLRLALGPPLGPLPDPEPGQAPGACPAAFRGSLLSGRPFPLSGAALPSMGLFLENRPGRIDSFSSRYGLQHQLRHVYRRGLPHHPPSCPAVVSCWKWHSFYRDHPCAAVVGQTAYRAHRKWKVAAYSSLCCSQPSYPALCAYLENGLFLG
uniref:Uncharacterized protein n=1 Tax=uncultured prokaryote TaxID=198431 RepID=A0A0H5Q477_9ZZZZ|nr:hypothetical protein [uncultured prokaryote]